VDPKIACREAPSGRETHVAAGAPMTEAFAVQQAAVIAILAMIDCRIVLRSSAIRIASAEPWVFRVPRPVAAAVREPPGRRLVSQFVECFQASRSGRRVLSWSTRHAVRWLRPRCASCSTRGRQSAARFLSQHEVATAFERGWSRLKNGELLDAAELEGFGHTVTTDSKLKSQQNLAARRIAIVVLLSTSWPRIERALHAVVAAVNGRFARHLHGSRDSVG